MFALTLTQPYATLVALGEKQIETRSWHTPYRGLIAIHAAKGWPRNDQDWQFRDPDWVRLLTRLGLTDASKFPRGAVVATAMLTNCVRMGRTVDERFTPSLTGYGVLSDQEQLVGWFESGRFAWLLADVVTLPEPIPARGQLGLWEWDESLMAVAS